MEKTGVSKLSEISSSKEKWIRIPYLGRASEDLSHELHRYGYRTGFYPVTRVGDLSILKDTIEPHEKSAIHSLKCKCGSEYVGQSGRALQERFLSLIHI